MSDPFTSETQLQHHASCVVVDQQAALIVGESGSGKSSLALAMMAYGAQLLADDQVILRLIDNQIIATCPDPIHGLIEARGVGLLKCNPAASTQVKVVVDLNEIEKSRLPEEHTTNLLGLPLPVLYKVEAPHFPAALIQYLKSGRQEQ